jgi:hypothetical protein
LDAASDRRTALGWAYTVGGEPDAGLFAEVLGAWAPYAWVRWAIGERGVARDAGAVAEYFKAQYAPYEPYAKCLFNPNKAEGLVKLHELFG